MIFICKRLREKTSVIDESMVEIWNNEEDEIWNNYLPKSKEIKNLNINIDE
ncbi:MAG: hypothetical protein AABW90_02790 [Nanoarchaeota archaeon]